MKKADDSQKMEKIIALTKRRGFVFPGSEIYGGLAGIYDYGPLGSELRFNIKQYFWKTFVLDREDVYGMSAAILMPEKVWDASGHLANFTDPISTCEKCGHVFRTDQLENQKVCPDCGGKLKDRGNFNLMLNVSLGADANSDQNKNTSYLRGEITQGVHVNFKNIVDSMHPKIPFGIAQIGKAFRNEIAPRDFLFRQREFEQMELQYYIRPDEKEGEKQFEYWKQASFNWYLGLGIKKENLRLREHAEDERAHYAKDAWDIEYQTPAGWKEAWGIHHRGDWDLSRHQKYSGQSMEYTDYEGQKFVPWDIECSGGVDRAFMFTLLDAYREDELNNEKRIYLALKSTLAPVRVAVFPLLKNKPELVAKAREVYATIKKEFPSAVFDDNGNIGKRYRRQDEIGTPHCVTIDFETLEGKGVTIRDRDTGKQDRVGESEISNYLKKE